MKEIFSHFIFCFLYGNCQEKLSANYKIAPHRNRLVISITISSYFKQLVLTMLLGCLFVNAQAKKNLVINQTVCENSTITFTGTGFPIGSGTFPAGLYWLVLVDNATNQVVGNTISSQVRLFNRGPLSIQSFPINASIFPGGVLPSNFVYRLIRDGLLFNEIAPVSVDVFVNSENITNIVAYQSYTWPNNGQTYTQSGVFTGTTTNCVTEKLNLTITNQPPIQVLDFDGVNDYASIPNNATLNPAKFTIDTWIKWGRSGTAIDFICSKANEVMELHTGGLLGNNIRFIPVPGVFLDGGVNTVTPNTWVHIAAVYDPSQSLAKVYINGVDIPLTKSGSNPLTTPVPTTSSNLTLGSRSNLTFPFKGQMDNFRIWNRVLTQAEIQNYRICGTPTTTTGLLADVGFNQGVAYGNNTAISSLTDNSGNNNHASLNNFTLLNASSNFILSTPLVGAIGIVLGSVENLSETATSFTLPYTISCGTPTQYSLTSNMPNFVAISNAALTNSPLLITLPANTSAGLYNFILIFRDASSGFEVTVPFSVNKIGTAANALDFDGINDYASIVNNVSLNPTAFTIDTWVKWGNSGNAINFICSKANEVMELHTGGSADNNIRFIPAPGVYLDGGVNTITPGSWVHIAAMYNPSQSFAKLYINGTDVPLTNNGTAPLSTPVGNTTSNFVFGSRFNQTYPFKGQIDRFRLWSRILTQQEVQSFSHCGVEPSVSALSIDLQMNQGIDNGFNTSITVLTDASGLGNNATLNNFALTGTNSNFVFSDSTSGAFGAAVGSIANVSLGASTFILPYTITCGSPTHYRLNSNLPNFTAVPTTTLTASPLTVALPNNLAIGAYNFVLTLRNGSSGFEVNLPFTINITNATIWNGLTWSNGSPSVGLDAVITSSTAPPSFTCKALTINNGFALNTTGISATINDNIINNGNGIVGTGNVIIAANSILSGNPVAFNGTLTVNSGATFNTSNLLTLTSNSTNTGRIGNSAGTISGNVTVQRFIPAKAARKWSFVSSPVSQTLAAGWQQQIHITGAGTGGTICPSLTPHTNGFDATQLNNPSVFSYNASNANGSRWTAATNTNATLTIAGTGYRVLVRGPRIGGCALLDGTSNVPSAVTLSSTGAISNAVKNVGSFSITYNNNLANNWVLVGNPYPSQISFSAFRATNSTKISNTYAIYNPESNNGVYTYWDGTSFTGGATIPNTTGNVLPSGSAFFVQSKAATDLSLDFTEVHKTASTAVSYQRNSGIAKQIRVHYQSSDNTQLDEVVVRYINSKNTNATTDIVSMNSGSNYITALKAGKGMVIQYRDENNLENDEVALNVVSTVNGTYKLNFSQYEQLQQATAIYLKDKYTNSLINLNSIGNEGYSFTTDKNNAQTTGADRFSLVFRGINPSVTSINNVKLFPNPASEKVTLQLPKNQQGEVYTIKIKDISGKVQLLQKLAGGVQHLNINGLATGNYLIEVTDCKGKRITEKLMKQ